MRGIARRAALSTAVLGIVALGAGCAQLAGIEETTCSVRHAYACKCACTGGGESFSLNNDVCLPESLNPALNPDLPPDFVPTSDDLRQDCETRVESNLEQMARQCVADRIRCSCAGIAELTPSCNDCDSQCAGENLAADCSNFDPQAGVVTATNAPGQQPVCIAGEPGSAGPAPLASAIFGRTSECQVGGTVAVARDGDTRMPEATGVAEFTGTPCPGGTCAVGVSYGLDHVDNFSFDGFGGFTSVEFKDITAGGTSGTGVALIDTTGSGAFPPATTSNTGNGRRSNQVLGGEVSSDSAAYTGTNDAPLDVRVDWANHACALSGSVLGVIEDSETAIGVNLTGSIVNEPPTASAAATPRTVECTSPAGADVTLDGSASTDPENNIALFAWRRDSRTGADVGGDPVTHVSQPLGVTQPYALTVVDALGQASEDATAVTVVDTTPPAIASVTASPATPVAAEPQDGADHRHHHGGRRLRRDDLRDRERHEQRARERDRRRQHRRRLADHRAEHGQRAGGTLGRREWPGLHAHGALHRSRPAMRRRVPRRSPSHTEASQPSCQAVKMPIEPSALQRWYPRRPASMRPVAPERVRRREREGKCRAALGVGSAPQRAALRLDDLLADREPHAEALLLGGEEGLEELLHIVDRQPWPIVAHTDLDAAVGGRSRFARRSSGDQASARPSPRGRCAAGSGPPVRSG